jgi:hypothetical protein
MGASFELADGCADRLRDRLEATRYSSGGPSAELALEVEKPELEIVLSAGEPGIGE